MQWHPDRNPGDKDCEHKFKEINEAYDILKDEREACRLRPLRPRRLRAGQRRRRARLRSRFRFGLLRHLRRHLRHGRRAPAHLGRERGADLRFNMEITLEEAYAGKTAQMRLPTSVTCETCSGSGAKAGTKPKTCQHCNGHGRIRHTQGGFFTLERTCPICQGRGQVIEDPVRPARARAG